MFSWALVLTVMDGQESNLQDILFFVNILSCNMNKYLYCQIMVFLDLGILWFKPLTALRGLKNKFAQVLKHHNLSIEVFIYT